MGIEIAPTGRGRDRWRWPGQPTSTKPVATRCFTPVQRRMLAVLADGLPHSREELFKCLWDEQSQLKSIAHPICIIRKFLRPVGQDIICEFIDRRLYYRHITLLVVPNPFIKSE